MAKALQRLVCCALIAAATAAAARPSVPQPYRGVWARDGQCHNVRARLVLRDSTAQLGGSTPMPVILVPHDSPDGQNALHWAGEGNVDNFVLRTHPDTIIHNSQGYGMAGAERYQRCAR